MIRYLLQEVPISFIDTNTSIAAILHTVQGPGTKRLLG
jgi:hypothetical protein